MPLRDRAFDADDLVGRSKEKGAGVVYLAARYELEGRLLGGLERDKSPDSDMLMLGEGVRVRADGGSGLGRAVNALPI